MDFKVGDYVINRFDIKSATSMLNGDYEFKYEGILGRIIELTEDHKYCRVKYGDFVWRELENNLIIAKPEIEDF